jgi:opacity protein-like surface antigen
MRRWSLGTALLAALAFGAAPLTAQSSVSVGPMAGVSFSSFSGDDADDFSDGGVSFEKGSRTGFAVGGFAEFEFGSNFAIEPQLLYIQKGVKYDGEVDVGEGELVDVSAGINLDYIQLPVLFKAELRKPDSKITPSVFVGPALGFQIGCKITAEGDGEELSDDCPDDTFKSTDFSLVFGAGLEFNRFSLQGRYDMGLGSVADADGADVKNSGFLVTLGYAFRVR